MRSASIILAILLTTACGNDSAGAGNQAPGASSAPDSSETKREKKDRGALTMLIDGVEWSATSARARLRDGKLNISGSRMDGSPSTTMVRQALDLDIADFDGPGTYTLGMMSSFSVVGMDTGKAEEANLDQQLADVLSKASIVQLQGSEVVIGSVSDVEITGRFSAGQINSYGGEPISITDGTFRAIIKN